MITTILIKKGIEKDLTFKLDSLSERVSDVDKKDCPICMQKVNKPCMTPCCKNIFCFGCLATACNFSKDTCPLCRSKMSF